jgi:hypothetical protein
MVEVAALSFWKAVIKGSIFLEDIERMAVLPSSL